MAESRTQLDPLTPEERPPTPVRSSAIVDLMMVRIEQRPDGAIDVDLELRIHHPPATPGQVMKALSRMLAGMVLEDEG